LKSRAALFVAILLAGLAAIGLRAYMTQMRRQYTARSKQVPVLFAARNIRSGTSIGAEMVEERMVDELAVQDGRTLMQQDLGRILGLPILANVAAGEMLRWDYFRKARGQIDSSTGLDTPGFRAITIPVDKVSGCGGRLLPGSQVDILATIRERGTDPNQPVQPVTLTALTDIRVIATDLNAQVPSTFVSSRERRDFAAYSTVTLRVDDVAARLLVHLVDQAKIHLVIRAPDDDTGLDPTVMERVTTRNLDQMIQRAAKRAEERRKAAAEAVSGRRP
jgi:pilus assembly protein CpaB